MSVALGDSLRLESGHIYRQLARHLAAAIDEGRFVVGAPLPTEFELARQYGVSRHTVRRALSELKAEGLIVSRPGIGSVPIRTQSRARYAETYSSIEELVRYAHGRSLTPMLIEDVVADKTLADEVGWEAGRALLRIVGLRYDAANKPGLPIGHVTVWVDGRFASIRVRLRRLKGSVIELVESEYGQRAERIAQKIDVALVPEMAADALNVEPGSPALRIERRYIAAGNRQLEASIGYYPMGRFAYYNELSRRTGS